MGKTVLRVYAVAVYVFLFLPILVVVALAFNGGRQVLFWEGFSTKWFGEALRDPTITEPLRTSLEIAVVNALIACVLGDDARPRAAAHARLAARRSTRSPT